MHLTLRSCDQVPENELAQTHELVDDEIAGGWADAFATSASTGCAFPQEIAGVVVRLRTSLSVPLAAIAAVTLTTIGQCTACSTECAVSSRTKGAISARSAKENP